MLYNIYSEIEKKTHLNSPVCLPISLWWDDLGWTWLVLVSNLKSRGWMGGYLSYAFHSLWSSGLVGVWSSGWGVKHQLATKQTHFKSLLVSLLTAYRSQLNHMTNSKISGQWNISRLVGRYVGMKISWTIIQGISSQRFLSILQIISIF